MLSASSSNRAQFMEPFGLAHLLMTGSASSPSRRSRTRPRTVTPPPSPRPLRQTQHASEPALRPAKVNRAGRKDEDRQVREVLSNVSDRSYALFQAASARFIHELAAMRRTVRTCQKREMAAGWALTGCNLADSAK